MRRSFVYKARLAPSAKRKAEGQLALCCELYNAALEHRREAWKQRVSIGYFAQSAEMPGLKELRPEFKAIGSQVLLNVLKRVDLAFQGFYRRSRSGQNPGYPRFRTPRRYDSLTFRALQGWKIDGNRLTMQGIGTARLFLSRPIEGRIRTLTLKRDACGDWWVSFACDGVANDVLPEVRQSVGIDLGLNVFIATSSGEFVPNPRPIVAEDAKRKRLQRSISRQAKGGANRAKRGKIRARQHRRVERIRGDFHHKTALDFIRRYDFIAVEDLNVAGLGRSFLARSVYDAGWSSFLQTLSDKAEKAGRLVVRVNPRGTSQVCSGCACEVKKTLAVRVHDCPECGLSIDRDVNAARNILALAIQGEAHPLASRPRSKVAA